MSVTVIIARGGIVCRQAPLDRVVTSIATMLEVPYQYSIGPANYGKIGYAVAVIITSDRLIARCSEKESVKSPIRAV